MDKSQAIKILTELANLAQKNGLIGDIMTAGTVYTALVVLSQDIPMPKSEEMIEVPVDSVSSTEEPTAEETTQE